MICTKKAKKCTRNLCRTFSEHPKSEPNFPYKICYQQPPRRSTGTDDLQNPRPPARKPRDRAILTPRSAKSRRLDPTADTNKGQMRSYCQNQRIPLPNRSGLCPDLRRFCRLSAGKRSGINRLLVGWF